MNRRDAVKRVAILMGGVVSASTLSVMLDSCNNSTEKGSGNHFSTDEKEMINRMADVIIPSTDTPGAVEAEVPAFIVMMMQECYPKDDQKQFHDGLAAFDAFCKEQYQHPFLDLSAEEQETAVADLDSKVLGEGEQKDKDLDFYRKFKELTLLGFFTSETGATETLRYVQVPSKYEGCVPYHEGDRAWAT